MKPRSIAFVVALAWAGAAAPGPGRADPQPEVLTLDRAVEIALQQQPSLRQTRAAYEAAQGRIDQARVATRPTLSVSASVGAGSTRTGLCLDGSVSPTCGGFFAAGFTSGLNAQASWRIYDFGQTQQTLRAAELQAEASAAGVDVTALDVRVGVERAYFEAVARAQLVKVAEATVTSEDQHLDQARRFVAAQAKDPIEVAQAQARAATARSSLAQARSAEAIALANFRAAMGWVDALRTPVPDPRWPVPLDESPPELDVLVGAARQQRPEFFRIDKQVAAAEATVVAAQYTRRPILSANASTQWNPSSTNIKPEPAWNAGVVLRWEVFDGGRSEAEQRIARANLAAARAERDALLVQLTSQLELSRAQIIANRANVAASEEAVTAARAQLRLAEARYTQGLGSQIELADAQWAVTTAEGNIVQAHWQLADAWTQLRRAMGTK